MMTQFDARVYGDAQTVLDVLSVLMMGGAVTDMRPLKDFEDCPASCRVTVVNSVFVDFAEIKQAIEEKFGVGKYDDAIGIVTATIVRSNG